MKNKKEFFGVIISVLVCVFIVGLAVYATTTIGDDITVGGNDLNFANGAIMSNSSGDDILILTETLVSIAGKASISGDLKIEGNDLTFGNTAVLSNAADAELLTITEDLVSIVGKASVSSTFYVGDLATFGAAASVSAGDLSIESGDFSVSGNSTFGGVVSASDDTGIMVGGGAKMFGGTVSPSLECTKGSLYLQGGGTTFYICNPANVWNEITLTTI